MLAIYRKELRSYFINPVGYVYLAIFLAFSALCCCYTTIISTSYSVSSYFTYLIFSFIVLVPILTMRLFAEERKLKTEQLLLTAPVTITGMVLGKYLAAFTVYVSGVLLSCVNFIPLYVIADAEREGNSYSLVHIGPVTGQIVGSILAIILLGGALIAIGMFISSLCENQLSSAVITVGVIAGMVLLNVLNLLTDSDSQPLISVYAIRAVIDWISVLSRFSNFSSGIFDFSALFYYATLAALFVFFTVRVYEKRRWAD